MTEIQDIEKYMHEVGQNARIAARTLANATTALKNAALQAIAEQLQQQEAEIFAANERDVAQAQSQGLPAASVDRLRISKKVLSTMIDGVLQIQSLVDPIGQISELKYLPEGFQVGRMRMPLGVIGMIYESRPNVTIDAAALCIKSGNGVILRGGSEAYHSNHILTCCIQKALEKVKLPTAGVQLVGTTDRAAVGYLLQMHQFVDVIIPRGGKGLIERISNEAKIPVIKHLDGVCHVYIDDFADKEKAINVTLNSKTQRYSTCNTLETLLIAKSRAEEILPELGAMLQEKNVEIRGCEETLHLIPNSIAATEEDWYAEYLAPVLAIKVVENMDMAMDHIATYGSAHTDSIITENMNHAWRFLREVDSSSVMINASTRLADGYVYGLGAEIGISTDKIHARGPVGVLGLTNEKFIVIGDGHVRN